MSGQDLYSTHAELIEAVIAAVCRRHRLTPNRADELASEVRLKVIDDDYALLRQYCGRGSLRNYLVTVAEHALQDWRTREWGRWRPCREAERLGDLAVQLDRMLTRDGFSFEEAANALLIQGQAPSRSELEGIRARLAERPGRTMVGTDEAERLPATTGSAETNVAEQEQARLVARAGAGLAAVLGKLPPADQIILRLHYQDRLTLAAIAKRLGEQQKPFYRKFERLLAELERLLAGEGVNRELVAALFGSPALELPPALSRLPAGIESRGQSKDVTAGGRRV